MFKKLKTPKKLLFSFEDASRGELQVGFDGEPTLLEVALKNRIALGNSCGGMGTCGTCRIEVLSPEEGLEPRNEVETEMAEMRSFTQKERLACQLEACDGMKILVPLAQAEENS